MKLSLKIVTPVGVSYEKEVDSVVLPVSNGEIEVLPGHLPLITVIEPGELVAKAKNSKNDVFAIDSGFAKIANDNVFVLTDESLNINETDLADIDHAMERAKKALEEARTRREALDPAEIEKLDAKVKYQVATKLIKSRH